MRGLENQHRHTQAPGADKDYCQNNSNLTLLTVRKAADGRQLSVDRRLYLGTHTSATAETTRQKLRATCRVQQPNMPRNRY